MNEIRHYPVMWQEVLQYTDINPKIIMDWTCGHGGHSKLMLEKYKDSKLIAVDRDEKVLSKAKENLSSYLDRVKFVLSSYWDLEKILEKSVDVILLDLGVNMEHFKDAERWFSIKQNWPLDMRFDQRQKITAKYILKNYTQSKLEEIFNKWWDFKWKLLQSIVRAIVKSRHKLEITFDLVEALKKEDISSKKIAVVFQALRIETNKELEQLEKFLSKFQDYLNPGWRCLIITYHSIEDRLVKNRFKELDKNWFKNLTKKVILPSLEEIQKNKASRSAKLRIIEKL